MTKSELESKPLAELHALAAEQGVDGYRMLSKTELVDRLADGDSGTEPARGSESGGEGGGRRRRDRERKPRQPRQRDRGERGGRRAERKPDKEAAPPPQTSTEPVVAAPDRPKRKRRRRRWGRRRRDVRVHELLLPPSGGRAIVYAESREACSALLREVAAELSGASGGPDPIALLVDPAPEELAEWKRDAPAVEIVSAGQARHAGDALAQATRRAEGGEDVIVLIDSLSRFADAFKAANEAKDLFDAGQDVAGNGSLTVVAAVERPD
jgi:transcription termination factor Rho